MALGPDAVASTWTWLGLSPGLGLCIQIPVIPPFWLLYPYPGPLQAELPLADPPLLPVVFAVEPPHPARTRTWSVNASEQRKERKSRCMHTPDADGCGLPGLFCLNRLKHSAKWQDLLLIRRFLTEESSNACRAATVSAASAQLDNRSRIRIRSAAKMNRRRACPAGLCRKIEI